MSFLRRIKPQPKIFFQESMIAIEYDYKEIDANLETAKEQFFIKDYSTAYKGFRELIKKYPSDNINHRLANFYIMRLEKLGFKPENQSPKISFQI